MSYLVLARKYRPRNFAEMVGQDHVVQALTNALTSQRLHHAYFFTGTRGVGKTTVSRILAKSLNCQGSDGQGGITASPCGICQACKDIDAGRFVDYTELDAASNRGVDEVQALLEQAVYKPVQGRFKVFMIDEVHMLTNTAFNAMLKTLEEPPDYLKFVLATTDPQKVPVTVLSRCLQFNLRPMAPDTIREHLSHVLAQENVHCDVPSLRLIARAARGSMRDALSLTDQAIAFGSGQLEEVTIRKMLGSVDSTYVFQLLEALAVGDGKTVIETVELLRQYGLNAASALEEMAGILQHMAVMQAVHTAAVASASIVGLGEESDPDAARIQQLSTRMPADEIQLLYSICLHGRADLGLAPDEYAALTMVLLRLLAFKPKPGTGSPVSSGEADVPLAEKKTLNNDGPLKSAAEVPTGQQLKVVQSARHIDAERLIAETYEESRAESYEGLSPGTTNNALSQNIGVGNPLRNKSEQDKQLVAVTVRAQSEAPGFSKEKVSPHVVLIPTEDGDFWYELVQQLIDRGAITAMARELAMQSQLVARDEGQWLLRVESESLNQPSGREILSRALSDIGHPVVLAVEVGRVTDCPARRKTQASHARQKAAENLIANDPFVQAMMRDFDAKITTGSIRPM